MGYQRRVHGNSQLVLCCYNRMKLSLLLGFIFALSLFKPVPAPHIITWETLRQASSSNEKIQVVGSNGKLGIKTTNGGQFEVSGTNGQKLGIITTNGMQFKVVGGNGEQVGIITTNGKQLGLITPKGIQSLVIRKPKTNIKRRKFGKIVGPGK